MRQLFFALSLTFTLGPIPFARGDDQQLHCFRRHQLTDTYYSEGASAGDLDGDGQTDVVYGPYWFEGPSLTTKHEIYEPVAQDRNGYADHFFSWVHDFDGDGWNDVLTVGFPGTPAYVYENPGREKRGGHWDKHQVLDWVSNESPQLIDLVGDERPELVCTRDGRFGFATVNEKSPLGPWEFHPISGPVTAKRFGHGLGVGDINGDGRDDVLHAGGWFEQPESDAMTSRWVPHVANFSVAYGGAEMYAYDVDGDGDNDVITSEAAHDFGLSWYEQFADGGQIRFRRHEIMGDERADNPYGVLFSEPHSVNLADIDGDGLKDIVTGKTYYSHHRQSPMWDAGAVVYWFRLRRSESGVQWVPYQADDRAGIGRQLTVADVNEDGHPDLVVGGMKGGHVLIHETERVGDSEWEAAQPKPYDPPEVAAAEDAETLRGGRAPIDGATGRVAGAIEGESLETHVSAGTGRSQPMSNFRAGRWSGDSQLWWTGARPGETLKVTLPPKRGPVTVEVVLTCASDYGIVQLTLDGEPLGPPVDCYDPQVVTTGVLKFPVENLGEGAHTLEARIVGKNPEAKPAFMFGLDYVRLVGPDDSFPEPNDGVRPKSADGRVSDEYPHSGLSARAAAEAMQLPEGFRVTVGAAEPEVKQPIAMALDDRGRVWVAEAYEYPKRAEGDRGRDRILIFEDTDGDGSLDERTVFYEGLNLVSGLEVGFGGVWVGAAPYLMFIPDRDGDDVPDGDPEILLDGWGYQDTHETLNAFIWGPDGWLYGCHGVFTHSAVGTPGTPEDERTRINAGVWRYHPTRHEFEVFADGTSNPWGVDFNDHGEAFITACVIPHLYHMIPGGRYQRQAGQHFNRHTYRDIATIADHLHYLGATPHGGNLKSDAAGGGHAHAGAMIYLGDKWPERYRGQLFMNNIHGQRLNVDRLKPRGSGYVGTHEPDFLLTGDRASQILNLRYGPGGDAWMIDWYDMQACHRPQADLHDRSNGRIYRIAHGEPASPGPKIDLAAATDLELAELVLDANDWYVRHARKLLQHRAAVGEIDTSARQQLLDIASTHQDDTRVLRAMWALHVTGGVPRELGEQLLDHPSPHVRGWSIRLRLERSKPDSAFLTRLVGMAAEDPSPVVRLYLASAAQRLELGDRWDLLAALCSHPEDVSDHNLPLMIWYAAEPLAASEPERALALAMRAGDSIPLIREFMLRRIGSGEGDSSLAVLTRGLISAGGDEQRLAYLQAMRSALEGLRDVSVPEGWERAAGTLRGASSPRVRLLADALAAKFGDRESLQRLRATLEGGDASEANRRAALEALIEVKDAAFLPVLLRLVERRVSLRPRAIRGLARYEDARVPETLLALYPKFGRQAKRAALSTLCGRAGYAVELLGAVETGAVPGGDLTADLVRQLRYHRDDQLNTMLSRVWGSVRETSADKLEQIERYKTLVGTSSETPPDPSLGRSVFAKTCQNCHVLYGEGYKIGPDLTGSNRANLDYLLTNIVDPSAVMAKEYQPTVVLTVDGRIVVGLVKAEDDNSLTLQTTDELVTLGKNDIEQRSSSAQSMMPEDQLRQFTDHEVRSLFAYLQGKRQVPLPQAESAEE